MNLMMSILAAAGSLLVVGCGTMRPSVTSEESSESSCEMSEVIFTHFNSERVSIRSEDASVDWNANLVGHDVSTEISVVANVCLRPGQKITIVAGGRYEITMPTAAAPYFIVVSPPSFGPPSISTTPPLLD